MSGLLPLSRLTSNWLLYHYISTLAVACILLAIAIAIAGRRYVTPVAVAAAMPRPLDTLPPVARIAPISLIAVGLGLMIVLIGGSVAAGSRSGVSPYISR